MAIIHTVESPVDGSDIEAYGVLTSLFVDGDGHQINVTYSFWPSQSAKLAGKPPFKQKGYVISGQDYIDFVAEKRGVLDEIIGLVDTVTIGRGIPGSTKV